MSEPSQGYLHRAANKLLASALGSIVGFATDEPAAALTFDDGPHPVFTPRLLDTLAARGAKATFFVLGSRALKHPALVARMVAEGHELGNHSWNHPSLPLLSMSEQRSQLIRTQEVLAPNCNRFMRPPFGHQDLRTYLCARTLGYDIVSWSFHVEDWLDHEAERLAVVMEQKIKPGSIVLLHDRLHNSMDESYRDRGATIRAVEILLKNLSHFDFLTISDLAHRGKPRRKLAFREPEREFLNRLKTMP
jgi:peptidoglycan/xylan/chitin deacetylase (PgdA/CDA1 family)